MAPLTPLPRLAVRLLASVALVGTLGLPLAAPASAGGIGQPSNAALSQLRTLLDEHVEFIKRRDPVAAGTRGDERFNGRLPDVSPEGYAARREEIAARLSRLGAIDLSGLPESDRTTAEILRYDLTMQLAAAPFRREQMPISTMSGPQVTLPQLAQQVPLSAEKHHADYAARLEAIPAHLAQHIAQMRAGLAEGRVPPRITMAAAVEQCLAQASPQFEEDPTLSPFFRPFLGRPADDPLASRARDAIAGGIVPAFRELAVFLKDEYIPACRESVAIADGVDGPRAYDHAIRHHTTLELSAEQVHQIGLAEVARIKAEMLEVIARSDFMAHPSRLPGGTAAESLSGDALLAAFTGYLRADPRFYYSTAEELLEGYRAIAKRIDPELAKLFRVLPRNPYGVREIPLFAARSSPTAFYYSGSLKGGVPGYFMANTYRLDQRPRYSMIALTLHEAMPGHHLQIALADELGETGSQHEYHQWIGFTAFVEGWGLYAERLGMEMGDGKPLASGEDGARDGGGRGLFTDPYDDFGRLSFEMWRACRLVVDTGMHTRGWTRQQAIDYMLAHTGLAPYDIEREVDRYIGWPGQACAYKIGELKIRELRDVAEKRLGPAFDVRAFHDVVLGAGAVPLPVLEGRVKRWVEDGGK